MFSLPSPIHHLGLEDQQPQKNDYSEKHTSEGLRQERVLSISLFNTYAGEILKGWQRVKEKTTGHKDK